MILALLSNKSNTNKGLESIDVTYVKSVSATSARYVDNGGFRIKNITADTVGLWVICRDNRDSIYWVFSPGWNPEVITVVCRQNKTVKIGQ